MKATLELELALEVDFQPSEIVTLRYFHSSDGNRSMLQKLVRVRGSGSVWRKWEFNFDCKLKPCSVQSRTLVL